MEVVTTSARAAPVAVTNFAHMDVRMLDTRQRSSQWLTVYPLQRLTSTLPLHSRPKAQRITGRSDYFRKNSKKPGSVTVVDSRSGTSRLRLLTCSREPGSGEDSV